ncbi:MAG: tRNA-dihydrouridine synthase, partial [Kiritimatiellae bacterium]|nr:tRNA-dihydrouridine synthase [Kiritimatiellia bacterium]
MAGFTNAPTRALALRFGASLAYTEMAGVEGLAHEHSRLTWQLLETLPEERGRVVAHLYGREPEHFARAAEAIAATGRFAGIDINAGCPVPKVTAWGAGAALM